MSGLDMAQDDKKKIKQAVAIEYDPNDLAPKIVATGRGKVAERIIEQAKALLMERHHMTEPEAHKYLQKCAMDSGTGLLETAEMVISLSEI